VTTKGSSLGAFLGNKLPRELFLPLKVLSPVSLSLRAFVDSGACSCLSDRIVDKHKISTVDLPRPITYFLATGTSVTVSRYASLEIKVAGWSGQWRFLVLPLLFDAFMGSDWFTAVGGKIDLDASCVIVENVRTALVSNFTTPTSPHLAAIVQLPLPPPTSEFPAEYSAHRALLTPLRDRSDLPTDIGQFACGITLQAGAKLGYCRLHPQSQEEVEYQWTYLQKALASKWIRPSSSSTSSRMVFVRKQDGTLRGVVDYRRLNDATVKDRYPLPLQSDLFDRLHKAKRLTKIDLSNAYHLLPMVPEDCYLTAFATPFGLFEYLVMPQGLCNAPAIFQRFIRHVVGDCEYRQAIVYMDDILIFSEDPATHQRDVAEVLQRLDRYKLTIKLSKCFFNVDVVDFLGFRISHLGFSIDPARVATVAALPAPQTLKGLQRFLGFINHSRRFIPNFADIAACLHGLTRKGVRFEWKTQHQSAFDDLKNALMSAPVLGHPQFDAPFLVEIDASEVAIAGVLIQHDANREPRVIAYFSRLLTSAERNYPISDKELLALYASFQAWRHYLEGAQHPIRVRTDNRTVESFRTKNISNSRHARWALFFERFAFVLEHVAGSHNRADYLTRCHEGETCGIAAINKPVLNEDTCVLASLTLTSPSLDWMARVVLAQTSQPHSDAPRSAEGIAYHEGRLYLPTPELQATALQRLHDDALAGHLGRDKTLARVRAEFWWPSLSVDVAEYVAKCDVCQRSKNRTHPPYGLLVPLPVPHRPWESVSLDFLSDLPHAHSYSGVLVIVDRFSKMVEFVPIAGTPSAKSTADAVHCAIVCRYGFPTSVVSDRGPQFSSAFWRRFLELGGSSCSLSTAHHPQTDGQSERAIQALQQYLRTFCNFHQTNWPSLLPMAAAAFNTSWQFGLRSTPARTVLGYQPRMHFLAPSFPPSPADAYVRERTAIWETLHDNLLHAQELMKRRSDRFRSAPPALEQGSLVLLSTAHLRLPHPNRKLAPRWVGPFKVLEMVGTNACRLELPAAYAIHPVVNISQIEPYRGSPPASLNNSEPLPMKEVASILASKKTRKRRFYLVRWLGGDPSNDSWEAASSMVLIAPELVSRFHESRVAPQ
jgi:transposase InsO family protein